MKTRGLNDGLVMKNLETYINLVRVTNAIGYEYTMRSNGVTVQETPILPGKVFDGDINGYDLNYQPTKTTVSANWNGFGLPADAISQIEIESGIYIFLKRKGEMNSLFLNDKIVDFVATAVTGNIRELEGVFNSILLKSEMKGREISLNEVKDLVKNNIKKKVIIM